METDINGKRFKPDGGGSSNCQVEHESGDEKSATYNMDLDPPADHPAFCIDLILDQIFTKLCVKDLVSCSEVNRFWNTRARLLLHDRRTCLAKISGESPCLALKNLDQVLENSWSSPQFPLPYNGLSITVIKSHKCIRRKPVPSLFKNIFAKITFRCLKIYWAKDIPCPCVSFLKTIFKDYAANVEKLMILRLPYGEESLCEHFQVDPHQSWLPKLKELKIPSRKQFREGNVERSQIFELISAAPNLQSIDGVVLPGEVQFFLSKRKVHTVKEFEFCYGPGMLDLLSDFSSTHAKLRKLYVTNPLRVVLGWENEQTIISSLNSVLRDSANTLEEMTIDGIIFIFQYHSQLPSLNRLRSLCGLEKARHGEFPYFSEAFKLDFGATFPVLETVEFDEGFLNLFVRFADALYHGLDGQYCSTTVRNMRIMGNYSEERRALEVLGALFPNVIHFRKSRCSNPSAYFEHLPVVWPKLESANFDEVHAAHWRTLKLSSVCGINEEEAEVIADLDLSNYQLVPMKPCIGTMRNLKTLHAEILYWRDTSEADVDREVFPTTAMQLVVFKRLPHFSLSVAHRSFVWI